MTLTDSIGHFKLAGDRLVYYPDGEDRAINCLENLCLERVAKTVADATNQVQWKVSAQVTEFQGTYYLLLTKAMLHARRSGLPSARPPRSATPTLQPASSRATR